MSLTKREKFFIGVALMLAVFSLYYFLFLKPYTERMSSYNEDIAEKQANLRTSEQLQISHKKILEKIETDELAVNRLSKGIPLGFDQPLVLVYLDDAIVRHAAKGTFSFGEVYQTGHLNTCPVRVTIICNYNSLKKILSSFLEGEYFVKVTGLLIAVAGNQKAENEESEQPTESAKNLEVTMNLEFYNIAGDIPPGTSYSFSDGHRYGTDIFG